MDNAQIKENLPVQSRDGQRIGTIDHLEGNRIKLKKTDSKDGKHHFIPVDWVERADAGIVYLKKDAEECRTSISGDSSAHSERDMQGAGSDDGMSINQNKNNPNRMAS